MNTPVAVDRVQVDQSGPELGALLVTSAISTYRPVLTGGRASVSTCGGLSVTSRELSKTSALMKMPTTETAVHTVPLNLNIGIDYHVRNEHLKHFFFASSVAGVSKNRRPTTPPRS